MKKDWQAIKGIKNRSLKYFVIKASGDTASKLFQCYPEYFTERKTGLTVPPEELMKVNEAELAVTLKALKLPYVWFSYKGSCQGTSLAPKWVKTYYTNNQELDYFYRVDRKPGESFMYEGSAWVVLKIRFHPGDPLNASIFSCIAIPKECIDSTDHKVTFRSHNNEDHEGQYRCWGEVAAIDDEQLRKCFIHANEETLQRLKRGFKEYFCNNQYRLTFDETQRIFEQLYDAESFRVALHETGIKYELRHYYGNYSYSASRKPPRITSGIEGEFDLFSFDGTELKPGDVYDNQIVLVSICRYVYNPWHQKKVHEQIFIMSPTCDVIM